MAMLFLQTLLTKIICTELSEVKLQLVGTGYFHTHIQNRNPRLDDDFEH